MKENIQDIFEKVKNNIPQTILIFAILSIIAPFILTRKWNLIDFTETGQIGDTIGGITAPILNLLNAVLIYIAFTEQLNANKLLQFQIESEKNKEKLELDNLKHMILYDLSNNILPSLQNINDEIPRFLSNRKNNTKIGTYDMHVDFNDNLYKTADKSDLLKIFNDNFKLITQIYNRVNFISTKIPVNISHKYPTDRTNLHLINLSDEKYELLVERYSQKIEIESNSLLNKAIPKVKEDIEYILFIYGS